MSYFDYLRTGMLRNEVDVYVEMWNVKPSEIKQFISEFNELTQTQQRKGVWILDHLSQKNAAVVQPHRDYLYDLVTHSKDSSVRRESFGILYNLELTEEQDGRMLERAFSTLSSFDAETAERHKALQWVLRAAKSYPELYDEIIAGIELVKDFGTPAWKRYSSKLILKLEITKAKAFNSPEPRDTNAGPGQKPARPQPSPNIALPISKGRSISRRVGICIAPPKKLWVRFLAR